MNDTVHRLDGVTSSRKAVTGSRKVGDLRRRGEAGMEEHRRQVGRDERKVLFSSGFDDLVPVDAGTVVRDGDLNPLVHDLDSDLYGPRRRLAYTYPIIGWLDSVIDRVYDEMT